MHSGAVKKVTQSLLFLMLLITPLADEIVGVFQFRALCSEGTVVQVDEKKAFGRIVRYQRRGKDVYAANTVVKIRVDTASFKDVETDEILLSYKTYSATGGWLIRMLSISETNSPLIFNGYCAPKNEATVLKKLNIKELN
jgi:hypothetical protein